MAKAPLEKISEEQEPRDGSTIKDAYTKWLKEMYHAAPRKRKSKKKTMRIAALRHLQQPTESSAKKHVSSQEPETSVAIPVAVSSDAAAVALLEAQKRRFQLLADEANYSHYQYEAPWCPGLAFFALLANHAKSRATVASIQQGAFRRDGSKATRSEIFNFPVRVPPTVLRLSPSDGVVLMFTTEQQPQQDTEASSRSFSTGTRRTLQAEQNNTCHATDRVSNSSEWTLQFHFFRKRDAFDSRLPWILRVLTTDTVDPSSVVAILKISEASSPSSNPSNRVEPLSSIPEIELALKGLWDDGDERIKAVQTFVRTKGSNNASSSNAWIARPAYRKKDQSATTVWIITGNDAHFASTEWNSSQSSPPCQIVKCINAQSWQEPRVLVGTLCQYLDLQVLRPMGGGALAELVVDLVQDRHGHWWLLQVKALQLRRSQLLPTVSVKDSSRARSAPDRLETMSVISMASSKFVSSQPRAKWKCAGKYCHVMDDEDDGFVDGDEKGAEPSGYLTKKELLSCEFYDKYRSSGDASVSSGCTSLPNALAFYLQHQIHKRDRTALYEPQPLCSACIRRYYALRTQYAAQVSLESDSSPQETRKATKKKTEKKITASQSLAALPTGQLRMPPQTLPPLATLKSSASMPDVGLRSVPVAAPSYLDELDRIERLLNGGEDSLCRSQPQQDEPQDLSGSDSAQASISTKAKVAAPVSPVTSTSTLSWLQNPTREDRVDEMWQAIKLKPLTTSVTVAPAAGSRAYNTFSLQAALLEAVDGSRKPTAPVLSSSLRPSEPHLISITDCRRVFSDEGFREMLVQEATRRLVDMHQSVRLVVLPPDEESRGAHSDSSVGRMALRSIALDVAQLLDQEGVTNGFGSGGLPPIVDDAAGSGCLLMTIPAPSI